MPLSVLLAIAQDDKPIALGVGGAFALIALGLVVFAVYVGRDRDEKRE